MHTTAQVAERLQVDESHVRRLARAHGIGQRVSDRIRIFNDADVDALRGKLSGGKMGRPKGSGKR